jgi:hypothetical protein
VADGSKESNVKRTSTQDAEFPFEFCSECGTTVEATLVVNFTYVPAERGSRENGIQMEPDYDESVELHSAKVIFGSEILHEFTNLERFEERVWVWLKEQRMEV